MDISPGDTGVDSVSVLSGTSNSFFFFNFQEATYPIPRLLSKQNDSILLCLFRIIKETITCESALQSLSTQASPEFCRFRTPVAHSVGSAPNLYSSSLLPDGIF